MLSNLTNRLWWKDAALRAAYTALAIALPYLGAATLDAVPWLTVALAAALGFVASLVTSLAGLPEVEGVRLPWWLAAIERVVKTFAQSLVAGFVGATLITDVDWAFVLQAAALAALTSLVRLILATLPADPTTNRPITVTQNFVAPDYGAIQVEADSIRHKSVQTRE
jgi:hypothetical protein